MYYFDSSEALQELARNMRFVMAEIVEIKSTVREIKSKIGKQPDRVVFEQCKTVHEIGLMENRLRSSVTILDSLVCKSSNGALNIKKTKYYRHIFVHFVEM